MCRGHPSCSAATCAVPAAPRSPHTHTVPLRTSTTAARAELPPGSPQDAGPCVPCPWGTCPAQPAQRPAQRHRARRGTGMPSARTRHISPPKKAKSVLVLFFPFTSRILTGLPAVRAADAARAANSRPRHTQERVTYSTFALLESSSIYPSVHSNKHRSNPLKLFPDSSVESQAI